MDIKPKQISHPPSPQSTLDLMPSRDFSTIPVTLVTSEKLELSSDGVPTTAINSSKFNSGKLLFRLASFTAIYSTLSNSS